METEQSSFGETSPRTEPLPRSLDLLQRRLCPCGREPLDSRGRHVLGASCREKVERHVRRRFGAHRYGGRYAAEVPDVIQDCYKKLLGPGGLDSFRAAPGREAGDAFGAWLWTIVHYHCNNKVHYLLARRALNGAGLQSIPEASDALTPEQAFAREHIRELGERTVAEVAQTWRGKGPEWSERFDALLPLICEKDADAARACERLGIKDGHGRKLKHDLSEDIRCEWRKQVFDDLSIEPGLPPEAIELMIDREIETLFQEAYPGSGDPELDAEDEEPESTP